MNKDESLSIMKKCHDSNSNNMSKLLN